jgi:hypothetical protein
MPRRNLSPDEEAQIRNLYDEGKNSNQIAKEMNLAYQTVYRRVQKFKAENDQHGDATPEVQDAKVPAGRKRKKRNLATGATSAGLTRISTREVYQGELLTFIHDPSGKTVSIELNGYETICFGDKVFLSFARDVECMKALLSTGITPEDAGRAE